MREFFVTDEYDTTRRLSRRRAQAALTALLVAPLAVVACRPAAPGTGTGTASTGSAAGTVGLAVDPRDGSLLKAAGGLFRSTDKGQTWTALPVPAALQPKKLNRIATGLAVPARIVVAGPDARVLRSDDSGQTWTAIGAGLPSQQVQAVAAHSSRPEILYVALGGKQEPGVYRTLDNGAKWSKMDAGPPVAVASLTHSPLEGSMNTGWLYAGTPEGVYLSMDCF